MPSLSHAFCLSAPHSGGGKTTVSLALMRAFRNRGLSVQGFKCGPDYIDPSFHQQATNRPSLNLDTWMMGAEGVRSVWNRHAVKADIAICEGVMGLFDSRESGNMAGSTADCALVLDIPVFLIVQVKGMAGSLAALVTGFRDFHPHLRMAGVIANGVGSQRHAQLLANALDQEGLPPLVGSLPWRKEWILPERQLGLVPAEESDQLESWLSLLGQAAEEWMNLDQILKLSQKRITHPSLSAQPIKKHPVSLHHHKRLGIARDAAFRFYYEDNLDWLRNKGWELIAFSPLHDASLPDNLDALYLGGGYPEVFARQLSENISMKTAIRDFADSGGNIFAECGGYMYLGKTLVTADQTKYPMCGVINGISHMGSRLRSLGYREITFEQPKLSSSCPCPCSLPWHLPVPTLRGHEFHWSEMTLHEPYPPLYSYTDREGNVHHAGVNHGNIKAGYIHLYWAHIPKTGNHACHATPRFSGRILLMNGASSTGKTSLAHAFQRLSPCPVMVFSIDLFLPICGSDQQSVTKTIADTQLPLIEAFHAGIATAARSGAFVIVDHVIGENTEWYHDLKARLGSLPIKTVKVICRKDILVSREINRTDRRPDLPHALRQEETIHDDISYDMEVDTSEESSETCARSLLTQLVQNQFFNPNSFSVPS
ncbi:MAG: cobyrinate a,c-diamide synthase [Akkermansia sp.]